MAVGADETRPLPFVSVNVSSRQLLRHDLINDVKAVLARTGVAPETLKLEITESLVMQNPEYAAKVLRARSASSAPGLRSTISAPAIRRFPTCSASPSTRSRSTSPSCARTARRRRSILLRSIVTMAHDLGMEVIAEGAETEAEVMEVSEAGCEYAQGFVYGRPMTPQMVQQMVRRRPTPRLPAPARRGARRSSPSSTSFGKRCGGERPPSGVAGIR